MHGRDDTENMEYESDFTTYTMILKPNCDQKITYREKAN